MTSDKKGSEEILTEKQIAYAGLPLPPDSLEKYKLARAYVEHENTLVGQRTTWYITFQGFLFAALFVAIRLFDRNGFPACTPESPFVAFGVLLICSLGLLSSFLLFALQGAAYKQIKHVETWWNTTGASDSYPVITGRIKLSNGRFLLRADKLIALIVVVWILFMAALVAAGWRYSCPDTRSAVAVPGKASAVTTESAFCKSTSNRLAEGV